MVFTVIVWCSSRLSTVGVISLRCRNFVCLVFLWLHIQQPSLVISSHSDDALHHQCLLATLVLQSALFFSLSCQKRLPWQSSVTGLCVCAFKSLYLHNCEFKRKLEVFYYNDRFIKRHKNLLGVEHARSDDEFEDVLQGFEGSEDGLTLFPSTGHIQIPLQHRHQLSGREKWEKERERERERERGRQGNHERKKRKKEIIESELSFPPLMFYRLQS